MPLPDLPPGVMRRPPGRPRHVIDPAAVAEAAAALFAEGGYDMVSIEGVAERLGIPRATLYRTVPTKDHLLGILFERSTRNLSETAAALVEATVDPADRILGLIRLQIEAAVKMRNYLPVFHGGAGLPVEVYNRWHGWTHRYEALWADSVAEAIAAGILPLSDTVLTTRLLLGMCIWVSRWYRPSDTLSPDDITAAAARLLAHLHRAPDL